MDSVIAFTMKYYEVYLVISNGIDYHWYRRNSGGMWSHKPGTDVVKYLDASGNIIKNPAKANHNYPDYQYNDGGILLWVKRH
ncbi:MAG: hypothetical protein J6T70_05355 [Bacteroidales bacterium]|nr:hypothetical protein [Bacteroidales bacterium]